MIKHRILKDGKHTILIWSSGHDQSIINDKGYFSCFKFLCKIGMLCTLNKGGVLAYGTLALTAPQVRDFLLILLLGSS